MSAKNIRKVTVVGGGPAGMMAAAAAAEAGASVTLLERNEKLGKKLYITGKGRCNVTNACDASSFQKQVPRNPRFLFSVLQALPPAALMERLAAWGCPVMVERGDRVFPTSEKASDVTKAFEGQLGQRGVEVLLHQRAASLLTGGGRITGVRTEKGMQIPADAVVLCTGGKSYPSTGSTGDGYALLEALGHRLLPLKPALTPLLCDAPWITALQGLTLRNVRLTLKQGSKLLFSELGEMLFTHFGISGPLVLTASSCYPESGIPHTDLLLDLKPGLSEDQLNLRLLRGISQGGKRQLQTLLKSLLPSRLAETIPALCGLDAMKPAGDLRKAERIALASLIKALPLPVTATGPLDEAIVTRGGADVRQVNPATMESKLLPGLFIAGELLDLDAFTGGFNLHIAFATGFLAGRCAGQAAGGQDP